MGGWGWRNTILSFGYTVKGMTISVSAGSEIFYITLCKGFSRFTVQCTKRKQKATGITFMIKTIATKIAYLITLMQKRCAGN